MSNRYFRLQSFPQYFVALCCLGFFMSACYCQTPPTCCGEDSLCPDGMVCVDDPQGYCNRVCTQDIMCGGIAGIQCPEGMVCVDDPRDFCEPSTGGADCAGVCACF